MAVASAFGSGDVTDPVEIEPPDIAAYRTGNIGIPYALTFDSGVRMRDYGPFNDDDVDQVSLLAECGQHWRRKTADMATDTAYRFLFRLEMTPRDTAAPYILPATPPDDWIEITHVFVPESDRARFTEPFAGMEVIAKPGTVIAHDGYNAITTPYDDCVLIMPARRLVKNQTGARLGRLHPFAGSDDG